jgi:HAD superfamily hydrolase (TIGR01509 family)
MKPAAPDLVIFDMDDVLCRYDLGKRLRVLSSFSGRSPRDIRAAIWDSGFEDDSDAGSIGDAEAYLAEFSRRLGTRITTQQWIEARRAAMVPNEDVIGIARQIKARARLCLFSNNGPLMKRSLEAIFPAAHGLFGQEFYCSCELKARKPDPEAYLRLIARLEAEAHRCLFIDDKRSNVEGAVIAGLHGHLFTSRQALEREARSLGLLD